MDGLQPAKLFSTHGEDRAELKEAAKEAVGDGRMTAKQQQTLERQLGSIHVAQDIADRVL